MSGKKTERLTLRVTPEVKAQLEALAAAECRSVADQVAYLVIQATTRRQFEGKSPQFLTLKGSVKV